MRPSRKTAPSGSSRGPFRRCVFSFTGLYVMQVIMSNFEPFRARMEAQRAAMELAVRQGLRELSDFYRQLPPELLAESAKRVLGLMYLAYDQPNSDVLNQTILTLVEQRYRQGVTLMQALGVVAVPRRAFYETFRKAYPNDDLHEGLERLARAVEDASATIIDAYGKLAERNVEERIAAERRYRVLYDRSPIMMHSIDEQEGLIEMNAEWLQCLGYEPHEALGRKSAEFMTADSQRLMKEVVLPRIFGEGTIRDFPLQFVKKNGDVVDVLLSAIVMRHLSGAVDRVLAVLVDVTERLRTERALQVSEQYRSIVEKSPLGFCIHHNGTIAYSNAAMQQLLGVSSDKALEGKDILSFAPVEFHEALLPSMHDAAFSQDLLPTIENKILRVDGSIIDVEIVQQPIMYEGTKAMQFVYLDISARKRAEEALRRATVSESTLVAQEELIRALSCPLIPFGNGVLLMPLIGHINSGRASRIVEELASGVVSHQATVAILDVTGVPNVDAEVADALLRAASVARLLGAKVMLTGIQPGIAKVIVELGIDMREFTVKSSLREGLSAVVRNRGTY